VDVFNKGKASQLPPHHLYNLKINLEEGSAPPLGTIYPLSPVELEALRKFLDENIATGLLHFSSSPHGAPVLFVKTGWFLTPLRGFPWPQPDNQERPISVTPHIRPIRIP
jgi:hypothetical protein